MWACVLKRREWLVFEQRPHLFSAPLFSEERLIFRQRLWILLKTRFAIIGVLIKVSVLTTAIWKLFAPLLFYLKEHVKTCWVVHSRENRTKKRESFISLFVVKNLDIFPGTRIQPFLCDCRCQKAGQQGSAVVRPLLSAECRQDHGGAGHQGTWKLGCCDFHLPKFGISPYQLLSVSICLCPSVCKWHEEN